MVPTPLENFIVCALPNGADVKFITLVSGLCYLNSVIVLFI